jgi:hypothetical protein
MAIAGHTQAPHPARMAADTTRVTDTAKAAAAASANAEEDGDIGDPFVLFFLLAFAGMIVGGAIVGAAFVALVSGVIFLLTSVGILSAGVLVGLYRRSMTAAFKTVLVLAGSLSGLVTGAAGLYAANRHFHWHFEPRTAILAGASSGLIGGLLLGLVVFVLLRSFLRILKQKLAL